MFFYLSKVADFVLLPSTMIAVALLAAVWLMRQGYREAGRRTLTATLVAFAVAGLSPLGDAMAALLETRFTRPDLAGRRVDSIIVLGGAEDTSRRERLGLNAAAERLTEASVLARQFPQAKLVFTGGSSSVISEHSSGAADARQFFIAIGIPPEQILIEDRSRTTWENAVFSCRLVGCDRRGGGGMHLLVTSAWHMPRSIAVFRQAGVEVVAWPVDYRSPDRLVYKINTIPERLTRLDLVWREYIGLVAYRLTGRTATLFPAP